MSLVHFVRERIVPINAVIALSVTVSVVLDFLAPKAPFLAWLSYALAALVLGAMLAEIAAPEAVGRWRERSSGAVANTFKRLWMGERPAWRSPAWQIAAVVTVLVLVLGQVSKAKAQDGGLFASQFGTLANLQAAWLEVKRDTTVIKEGVNELRVLGKYHDASHALSNGDLEAIKGFMAKGQPLPPANTPTDYALASGLSHKRPDRFELLALYVRDGFDINQRGKVLDLVTNTPKATADKLEAWGKVKGIRYHPLNCELTLLHVATITADHEAVKWLTAHGANSEVKNTCEGAGGRTTKHFTVVEIEEEI